MNNELAPVKLTKKALNDFISWSNTRYNDYLGFGTKKQNIDTVYNSLKNGFYTNERGKQDESKKIFVIESASPVGESGPQGNKHHGKYWKTKTTGGKYQINCEEKTVEDLNSKTILKFIQ